MSNYDISVITPSHNTDPEMFRACFESMRAQTIGFDKIEWIIILHNCDDEHKQAILDIVKDYDNIKTHELVNDIHSPSSPRNAALDLATADYVGMIDADDRYTPDCLSKALYYIKSTDSDVVHFRRRIELEQPTEVLLNDIVLWDQTRETIVMNKDDCDPESFFVWLWAMCTQKVYRREFLDSNGIRFSDDVPFGEDGEFSFKVYGKAKRICLTPQFIGYIYYVNSKSMAQTLAIDDETLIRYCEGVVKAHQTGTENGVYMNATMAGYTLYMSIFMNSMPDVKPETRQRVKDLLGDIIRDLKPIRPSKVYPLAQAQAMNTLPQMLILGEQAAALHFLQRGVIPPANITDYQTDVLRAILSDNAGTDFGKRYGFDKMLSMEDYREAVPISNYDTYQPMVDLTRFIGEKDIFTCEEITSYVITHGILGTQRRLPMTASLMERYVDSFAELICDTRFFPMFESLPHNPSGKTMDTKYTSTLTGLIQTSYLDSSLKRPGHRISVASPHELMFPSELNNFDYIRFVFALRDKLVGTIFAPNAWILYSGIRRLKKEYKSLCDDIRNGTISQTGGISEELLDSISWRLVPSPTRADELERIFETKGDDITLKDIWPGLTLVVADGTGSYRIHKKKSEKYLAGVTYQNGILADECCVYGVSEENSDVYRINPNCGFFEFISVDDEETYYAFELEEGKEYRIIATTSAGLYRYKTDTFIKCLKCSEDELLVEKICPILYDLNLMDGLREEDVYDTVMAVEEKFGFNICDFSLLKDTEDGEYTLVMEPETDEDAGLAAAADKEEMAGFITKQLGERGNSSDIKVAPFFCEPESFFLHRDIKMHRWQVLPDDICPQHMVEYGTPRIFGKK